MTEPRGARDSRLKRNGGWLVIGSTVLVSTVAFYEDGGKTTGLYKVYADKLARGVPTACGGITGKATREAVIVGDVWSRERCDRVLGEVVQKTQYGILDCMRAPLSQNTFDALSDMAHNVGVTAVCGSVAAGLIDAGRLAEGCQAISTRPNGTPNWSYVSGTFYRGLHTRRLAEAALCARP